MSDDLHNRVIEIERRVRALEDAKTSYAISNVNANAQCSSEAIGEIITREVGRWFESRGHLQA